MMNCQFCGGTGFEGGAEDAERKCPKCEGTGVAPDPSKEQPETPTHTPPMVGAEDGFNTGPEPGSADDPTKGYDMTPPAAQRVVMVDEDAAKKAPDPELDNPVEPTKQHAVPTAAPEGEGDRNQQYEGATSEEVLEDRNE